MIFLHHLWNAAAQVTAERMVDSLVIGVALAVFAWALLRIVPRPNAATRFAVWFTALLGTAFLPLLQGPRTLVGTINPAHALISVPVSWASYAAAAWCAIAGLALLRVFIGLVELRRLRRGCRRIEHAPAEWQAIVTRLCPSRKVEILTSDRIHVPTAFGFIHPAIVIPAPLLQQLSAAELNQVLLHELAHLRRWDDWTNMAQKIVKALLIFHPAAWWMEGHISLEREMACDDAVLAETGSPRAYAECLAALAERKFMRRSASLAQAAVNRIRQTTARVARILDVNRPQGAPLRKSAVALVAAFACACLGLATQIPQLVSFQDAPPTFAAAATQAQPTNFRAAVEQPRTAAFVVPAAMKRRDFAPVATAKAVARKRTAERRANRVDMTERQMHEARVIPAKAATPLMITAAVAHYNPARRPLEGVLIIVVNDPVFGPTPVVFHFAVWPDAASHRAQGTSPKTI